MRIVNIGTKKHTEVRVIDEPALGCGANHKYEIVLVENRNIVACNVNFQDGPIKEAGVNGIHNEDLIAIVIDRMRGFQSGDYACRDNDLALTKLEESLFWLRNRTNEREARGVEGTNKK